MQKETQFVTKHCVGSFPCINIQSTSQEIQNLYFMAGKNIGCTLFLHSMCNYSVLN